MIEVCTEDMKRTERLALLLETYLAYQVWECACYAVVDYSTAIPYMVSSVGRISAERRDTNRRELDTLLATLSTQIGRSAAHTETLIMRWTEGEWDHVAGTLCNAM